MSDSQRPLKIVGSGGHGRVVADIARACGIMVAGFIDDGARGAPPGLRVEGPLSEVLPAAISTHRFVVAIGDAASRRSIAEMILGLGGELATLIHPASVIAPDVTIGVGSVVMAGVVINTGTRIGRFAIVNTGAIVDHDNLIEDNVQVAPSSSLAGGVICRRDCFVGTGAIIIPRMEIGEGAYVAAGAVVTKPVGPHTLVAGSPAVEKKAL